MDFYIFFLSGSTIYLHLGHVSQHGEDDEPRHEAGDAVDGAVSEGMLDVRDSGDSQQYLVMMASL